MPQSWRVVSAELRTAGRFDLERDLTRAVRRQGAPTLAAVRAAWGTVEVTSSAGGGSSSGLRARVAAATDVAVTRSGIRIVVRDRRVDPVYGRSLAWYLNGSGRPWRHPVFGRRRDPWAVQRGEEVFFATVDAHRPAFRRGIERAMEQAARDF